MERNLWLPLTAACPRWHVSKSAERRAEKSIRSSLLTAAGALLLAVLILAAPRAALAGAPLCKAKAAKPPVPAPPPTVLPPPGFPPPAVYGFPETSYRSGWYNTHYWPRKTYHHGFYGDYWQWGYFPGY